MLKFRYMPAMHPVPSVDHALRRDVRFLGRLLGQVIVRQEGEALFALEERVRRLAILRRRGPREHRQGAFAELTGMLAALPTEQMEPLIRAFSLYFQLVNLAEQHHRVRRARAYASKRRAPPQRGSLAASMRAAQGAGVLKKRMKETLEHLEVTLALTAHPSQAARRTVLEKLSRISELLEERDQRRLTVPEQEALEAELKRQIAALWQTDELRRERPTVGDEVKNVSYYIEEILFDLLPQMARNLQGAFKQTYGEALEVLPPFLRIHSWVGGDMDGNPLVTPSVFIDAIRAYQARGLRLLGERLARLGSSLSMSSRHVEVPAALQESLDRDAALAPRVAQRQEPRTEGEPWRRKLRFVEARLSGTLEQVESRRRQQEIGPQDAPVYTQASELEHDLDDIVRTLREAGAAGVEEAESVLLQVRALGFHLAELELRAPAEDARAAAVALDRKAQPTGDGGRFFGALQKLAEAQSEGGERGCRTLILSMALSADDVLAAFRCAREAGVATVDVVPLFETLESLEKSGEVMRSLFAHPEYAAHVKTRGVQEVMVGYSDSNKEVGPLAAKAAILTAQVTLHRLAQEAGVPLRLFHGRGESVARGGGPAQEAILALPPGAVSGRYKATEQGEALDHKYARPSLAIRTLELTTGGVLLHTLDAQPRAPAGAEEPYLKALQRMAQVSRDVYRGLVWDEPRFAEFFSAISPIDEIAQLPIASRPAKRRSGGMESLRAIPWVFAWTQNRAILPGWYGVGSALESLGQNRAGRQTLREMYNEWPPFRTMMDSVEMVLAKCDLKIASVYAGLAPPELRFLWTPIRTEYRRTTRWVKWLTGRKRLLEGSPSLRRSILLRNPYVDPMSVLQVELLKRKRAGATDCDRPLLLTLNGIAAGMRNTG
jgi:phosphoenolpyruvate carboxylase